MPHDDDHGRPPSPASKPRVPLSETYSLVAGPMGDAVNLRDVEHRHAMRCSNSDCSKTGKAYA
jgi:hypothetical protein